MMLTQAWRNPISIFTVEVHRISEVTETVLGPAVFVIVHTFLKKDRIAVVIAQEKRVPSDEIARQ